MPSAKQTKATKDSSLRSGKKHQHWAEDCEHWMPNVGRCNYGPGGRECDLPAFQCQSYRSREEHKQSLPLDKSIPISSNGIALIFQLIALGKISHVKDNRGHYYKVSADEITKEEFEHEQKNKRGHSADQTDEVAGREQSEEP